MQLIKRHLERFKISSHPNDVPIKCRNLKLMIFKVRSYLVLIGLSLKLSMYRMNIEFGPQSGDLYIKALELLNYPKVHEFHFFFKEVF